MTPLHWVAVATLAVTCLLSGYAFGGLRHGRRADIAVEEADYLALTVDVLSDAVAEHVPDPAIDEFGEVRA